MNVFHYGHQDVVGLECTCRQQPLAHRGPFKEKVFHPPAPRGDASEGASVLCTGTEEVARVNLLDLTFGHSAN